MLLPFCYCGSLHLLLISGRLDVVVVVSIVGQFQEEMLETRALRSDLVHVGIGID